MVITIATAGNNLCCYAQRITTSHTPELSG